MNNQFIKVTFDLYCDWTRKAPAYRIYVDGELFAERSYIWTDHYLEEMLQISAKPGQHQIKFENLNPESATFSMRNHKIISGAGTWVSNDILEIYNES